jgi:hypothetical protein
MFQQSGDTEFLANDVGVFIENVCTGAILVDVGDNLNGTAVVTEGRRFYTFDASAPWIGIEVHLRWEAFGPGTVTNTVSPNLRVHAETHDSVVSGSFTFNGVEQAVGTPTLASFGRATLISGVGN